MSRVFAVLAALVLVGLPQELLACGCRQRVVEVVREVVPVATFVPVPVLVPLYSIGYTPTYAAPAPSIGTTAGSVSAAPAAAPSSEIEALRAEIKALKAELSS